jgi:hypothetical protein
MGQGHSVSRPEDDFEPPTWAEHYRGYRHKRILWIGVDKSRPCPVTNLSPSEGLTRLLEIRFAAFSALSQLSLMVPRAGAHRFLEMLAARLAIPRDRPYAAASQSKHPEEDP